MINNDEKLLKTGVYVHFPYCKSKCAYCSFCSSADKSTAEDYVKSLCREINDRGNGASVNTVYFGGGTPSVMPFGSLTSAFGAIAKRFDLSELDEFTVEANPDSVTHDFIREIKSVGVNRVSMGLQSASDEILEKIGRVHTVGRFCQAVEALRDAGIDNISSDLIIGLDGQDESDVENAVKLWQDLGITHASVYSLSVEEGTPMYRSGYRPDPDRQADMYEFAVKMLRGAGFDRYEVSNFARNGKISLHNYKYWTGADYYGFGAAAHSKIGKTRRENPSDALAYINGAGIKEYGLSPSDERTEYIMLSLRTANGLNYERYLAVTGNDIRRERAKEIAELIKLGVAADDGENLRATDKGFYLLDSIITELM